MNPLVGIRLGHTQQLPLHLLDRIVFQVAQNEEQIVGHGG